VRDGARAFIDRKNNMNSGADRTDHLLGDASFGFYPTTLAVQGPALFYVAINGGGARSEPITDHLMERMRMRFAALGIEHYPPVSVQAQVLSKHVNRARGQQVRVVVTSNEPSMNYSFSFLRFAHIPLPPAHDERGQQRALELAFHNMVFSDEISSRTGTAEFVWDGRDMQGNPAANGHYTLEVFATDPILRTQLVTRADVEVNNQGPP